MKIAPEKRKWAGFAPVLAALLLAACSGGAPSTFDDAQAAYERHHYRTARIHLANLLADSEPDAKTRLLYVQLMLELGDGISAQSALRSLPDNALAAARRGELLAHALILQAKPDEAAILMEKQDRSKLTEQGYRMLVWAHQDQDTLEQQPGLIEEALRRYPESAYLHAQAGDVAINQGDWLLARDHAAKAIRHGPDNYQALVLNGRYQIGRGELEKARQHYARAMEVYPDHPVPPANVAGLYLDLGQADKAAETLKRALPKNPDFPFLLFQKARLDYRQEKFKDARTALAEARKGLADFGPLIALSGKVEAKIGNVETARLELSRALEIDPSDREARQLLEEI